MRMRKAKKEVCNKTRQDLRELLVRELCQRSMSLGDQERNTKIVHKCRMRKSFPIEHSNDILADLRETLSRADTSSLQYRQVEHMLREQERSKAPTVTKRERREHPDSRLFPSRPRCGYAFTNCTKAGELLQPSKSAKQTWSTRECTLSIRRRLG